MPRKAKAPEETPIKNTKKTNTIKSTTIKVNDSV